MNEASIFIFTTINKQLTTKKKKKEDLTPALSDGTAATRVGVRLSPRPAVVIRSPAPRTGDRVSAQRVITYVVGGGQKPPARFRAQLELITTAGTLTDRAITGRPLEEEVVVVGPSCGGRGGEES